MTKIRLPLFITNETTTLVTSENYVGLNLKKEDIGKYYYKFPQRFIDGRVFPKKIVVDHIGMYCKNHSIQFGSSAYADFVTESEQLPNCIGFVSLNFKTVEYKYLQTKGYSLVWLKKVHEDNDFHHCDRFVINGWLYF